jgi:hypothetical protein
MRKSKRDKTRPEATEGERVVHEKAKDDRSLGYTDSADHPGGEPDLDAKTDTESEHGDGA